MAPRGRFISPGETSVALLKVVAKFAGKIIHNRSLTSSACALFSSIKFNLNFVLLLELFPTKRVSTFLR